MVNGATGKAAVVPGGGLPGLSAGRARGEPKGAPAGKPVGGPGGVPGGVAAAGPVAAPGSEGGVAMGGPVVTPASNRKLVAGDAGDSAAGGAGKEGVPAVSRLPTVKIIRMKEGEELRNVPEVKGSLAEAGESAGPVTGNVNVSVGMSVEGMSVDEITGSGGAGGAETGGPVVTGKVAVGSTKAVSASVAPPQGEVDEATFERLFSGDVVVSRVAGGGAGLAAPPAAATTRSGRSYASVAAAGGSGGLPSSFPGSDSVVHRRLLEALKRGQTTMTVEGREVDLSFWTDQHGLRAFREKRGGETRWSLPTTGSGVARRNVVRLRWRGEETCPSRSKVVELLLQMGFKVADIFALIHPSGTPEFDISFVRPEGLELFWSCYELVKSKPGWRGFAVQAVSRQNNEKKVTVLTRNESLSGLDIMTWLSRYGEMRGLPGKILDEFGIWSGAWTFHIKLGRAGETVSHIPSSAFIGRDRILIFYQGQPKLCHKCGSPSHFSANCQVQRCAMCGGTGHLAAACNTIRCNLCGELGHPFSRCPRSSANAARTHVEESREAPSTEASAGGGEGAEGSGKRKEGPSRQRRRERRLKEGDRVEPCPGVMLGPLPEGASRESEALGVKEVSEEIRRLDREEALSSLSSHYESAEEAGGEESEEGAKNKTRKKRVSKKRKGVKTPPPSARLSVEDKTSSPLVGLPNRFRALDNISAYSSSEEEAQGEEPEELEGESQGGLVPASGEDARSSEGEARSEPGTEEGGGGTGVPSTMDTSVSLKRSRAVLNGSPGRSGKGRRK